MFQENKANANNPKMYKAYLSSMIPVLETLQLIAFKRHRQQGNQVGSKNLSNLSFNTWETIILDE
jgi:hypothetical protein